MAPLQGVAAITTAGEVFLHHAGNLTRTDKSGFNKFRRTLQQHIKRTYGFAYVDIVVPILGQDSLPFKAIASDYTVSFGSQSKPKGLTGYAYFHNTDLWIVGKHDEQQEKPDPVLGRAGVHVYDVLSDTSDLPTLVRSQSDPVVKDLRSTVIIPKKLWQSTRCVVFFDSDARYPICPFAVREEFSRFAESLAMMYRLLHETEANTDEMSKSQDFLERELR